MRFLRTNTAIRLTVGPFLDKTDGVTPEVALTVTSCKLTLMVDDANVPTLVLDAAATASSGNNDMVHVTGDDAGFYDLELTAANLNYLGRAMLAITDAATHCPVFHEFMILPAMIYDSLVLGSDRLDTNVTHVGDTAQTARDIGASVLLSNGTGTGQVKIASGYLAMTWADIGAPTTTVNLSGTTIKTATDLATAIDAVDNFVDAEIADIQSRLPAALTSDGNIKADTLRLGGTLQTARDIGASVLVGDKTGFRLSATGVDDIWDEAFSGHATPGTTGYAANEIDTIYGTYGVNGLAVNAVYFNGVAAQTSIRAAVGLASANLDTQLGAIDDYIDTELAALTTTVGALWTTALTEAYRTDGSAGTGAQILYELLAHHNEVAISSTTKRTNKIDGTTQAASYTLNSATTPTAITRAA